MLTRIESFTLNRVCYLEKSMLPMMKCVTKDGVSYLGWSLLLRMESVTKDGVCLLTRMGSVNYEELCYMGCYFAP